MLHKIGMDYTDILKERKNKRDLPFVLRLKKKIDIEKVQTQLANLLSEVDKTQGDYRFDRASTEHNYDLSNKEGKNFVSNYSEIYKTYAKIGFQSLSDEALELGKTISKTVDQYTPYERAKGMIHTDSIFYHPYYDERNYNKKTEFYSGYIGEFLDSFKDDVCRSAAVCLQPGKFLTPHFDIGPEFVVRLQIPIYTNKEAVMGFRKDKDTWHEFHLPADGSIYFVNSGWEHYAVNNGIENRYNIRVCLNGQLELEDAEEVLPTSIFSHEIFSHRPESGSYFGKNNNNIVDVALTELGMNATEYSKYASTKV